MTRAVLACRHCARSRARPIAADKSLRNFVLNEPRGGVFRHVNLLAGQAGAGAYGIGSRPAGLSCDYCQRSLPSPLTNNNYSHYHFFTVQLTGSRLRENELNDTAHRQ